jgi:hypothetical protein
MESNQIQWVGFLLHGIQNATCTNHIDKYGLSMRGVGEQLRAGRNVAAGLTEAPGMTLGGTVNNFMNKAPCSSS